MSKHDSWRGRQVAGFFPRSQLWTNGNGDRSLRFHFVNVSRLRVGHLGKSPLPLKAISSVAKSGDAGLPMALDFGLDPHVYTPGENQRWLSSHSSSFPSPDAENKNGDLTVNHLQTSHLDRERDGFRSVLDHNIPRSVEGVTPDAEAQIETHCMRNNAIDSLLAEAQNRHNEDAREEDFRRSLAEFIIPEI